MSDKPAKQVVAENITTLIGVKSRRAWAIEHKLDLKLVERLQRGMNSPTLANLEAVANAVKLPLWQLLAPNLGAGLNSKQTPPAWPFEDVDQASVLALNTKQLAKVDLRLEDAMKEVSGEFTTPKAANGH